jgi:hypothetical protein
MEVLCLAPQALDFAGGALNERIGRRAGESNLLQKKLLREGPSCQMKEDRDCIGKPFGCYPLTKRPQMAFKSIDFCCHINGRLIRLLNGVQEQPSR